MNQKTLLNVAGITLLSVLAPLALWAQGPGGGVPGDPGGTPIDGGLSLLAGAAVAYGAKKLRDHQKKKNQETEH